MVKLHLKPNSFVFYYGERYTTNFNHWVTKPTKEQAIESMRKSIADKELFSKGIWEWVHIVIEQGELEIIEL